MDWKIERESKRVVHSSGMTLGFYSFAGELRELVPGNIPEDLSAREVSRLVQAGKNQIAQHFGLVLNGKRVHVIL
ncbi:hypothetical protein BTA51_17145 [Hahella sp. CCB-MM4]|uniref:hypothetical protein n=1 Tax=Hahella sp. (strain CCB-MM4) TaxID=1926491 RepID=UPI000B9BCB60|nr:hypothetical protein [Hahella sp. CCB-MM4]OZG72091.1 hypothetical protein BTA51_17145 [Hahella sp. CCB-MM4]